MKLSLNPEIVSRAHVLYSMRGELLICSPNIHIITSFPCTCCLTIILPCGDLLWLKHCAKGSCAFAPLCCVCCDWLCHFKQTPNVQIYSSTLNVQDCARPGHWLRCHLLDFALPRGPQGDRQRPEQQRGLWGAARAEAAKDGGGGDRK